VIAIPRTSLLCADCQCPALAARALALSLRQCAYERTQLFTDARDVPELDPRIEIVAIPKISSAVEYSRFVLKDLLRFAETDFVQIVQWDGYVTNGAGWRDAFLDYDYIGARWWFRENGRNVGNGGFSLRSRRLLEALQDPEIKATDPEDNAICLDNRELLERRYGIRIAPAAVADAYAFEGTRPSGREFGFHRLFNFPHFHDEAGLAELMAMVPDSIFCSEVALTLVRNLLALGRNAEALRYASKAMDQPALPPVLRGDYERLVKAEIKRAHRRERRVREQNRAV